MAKILFLGEIEPGQTSLMRMRAFKRLGHEVRGVHTIEPWRRTSWFQRQLQRRLHRGPIIDRINSMVLKAAREFKPELVWAEKQEYLHLQTLRDMHHLGTRLIHFTPDPYFSLDWKRTPLMDKAMAAFDVLVYCKAYEHTNYKAMGPPTVYMPLGYCDEVHRPLKSSDSRWDCEVGFLGGWEPRREHLLHTVAQTNIRLKIWGGAWDFLHDGRWTLRRQIVLRQLAGKDGFRFHRDPLLAAAHQGGEVYADDYARALAGARIGLGFLRKVCDDQHTTRTFEIPACGSMLLADRTTEHQEFFREGIEADYFKGEEELIDKIHFYSTNQQARRRISSAGLRRCRTSRYSYIQRLSDALQIISEL